MLVQTHSDQAKSYYGVCQGQLLYKHFKPALLLRKANFLYLGYSEHQGSQWDLSGVLHGTEESKTATYRSSAGLQQLRSPRQYLCSV